VKLKLNLFPLIKEMGVDLMTNGLPLDKFKGHAVAIGLKKTPR
jgi:hypothetical protein